MLNPLTETSSDTLLTGDTNADGTVNVKDAVLLAQYVGNETVSGFAAGNADINSDGLVNTDDLTALMARFANLS